MRTKRFSSFKARARNVTLRNHKQRFRSSGIRKYYYIFMTALVGYGHLSEKGFPRNNPRAAYFASNAKHSVASRMLYPNAVIV